MHTDEEWRTIPRYPDYEVSNLGRVRSWKLIGGENITGRRPSKPRMMTGSPNPCGYLNIGLVNADGRRQTRHIHSLVALAFFGERPPGYQVCHGDNDKANNHVSNLRYDTAKANMQDQITHGTSAAERKRQQTHCQRGHEFTPENTLNEPTKYGISRRCVTCRRVTVAKRMEARRQKRAAERAALPEVA